MTTFSVIETASIVRVLSDIIPDAVLKRADCVYAFAEDPDHVNDTVSKAVDIYRRTDKGILAVAGWDHDRFGYPGASAYREVAESLLKESDFRFEPVPPVDHAFGNTRTESLALAEHIARKGWHDVIIVAPIVHQPRAFLTAVHAVLELGVNARLYNAIAPGVWSKTVEHNQRRRLKKSFIANSRVSARTIVKDTFPSGTKS
jgi:hypothetical protein